MKRARQILPILTVVVIAIGLALTPAAQAALYACAAFGFSTEIAKRNRRIKPEARFWQYVAASVAVSGCAAIARMAGAITDNAALSRIAAAAMLIVAGGLTTYATMSMTRTRAKRMRARWAMMADAFLIAAAFGMVVWAVLVVPYINRPETTPLGTAFAVGVSSMAILQFAMTVHSMLVGGRNSKTWNTVIAAQVAIFGGLFAMLLEATDVLVAHSYMIASACFVAAAGTVTLAILREDVSDLLEPLVPTNRTSRPRLFMLALAVLTPPVTMVTTTVHTHAIGNVIWLGTCWAGTTALLMFRFGEMIYARERAARLERILAVGASKLGNCTTRTEICELSVKVLLELAEGVEGIRAAVATKTDQGWLFTTAPSNAQRFPGFDTIDQLLETWMPLRGFLPFEDAIGLASLDTSRAQRTHRRNGTQISTIDIPEVRDTVASQQVQMPPRRRNGAINAEHWIGVRYLAKDQPAGVLLIVSESALPHAVEDAMASLANNVSLALEAASLSEHLHLQRSDRRFRALVEHSRDVIVVINGQGKTSFRSPAAEELFAKHPGEEHLVRLMTPSDRKSFYELIETVWSSKTKLGVVQGRIVVDEDTVNWYEFTVTDMRDNEEIGGIVINGRDITERKSLEADLRHRATHDDLTALPNRAYLRGRLDRALAQLGRNGGNVAAMFVDLDDFKVVNDGLGHEAGDELLRVIAFRISSYVRETDTPARLGGDEFAVLFEGFDDVEHLESMAKRLLNVIIEPVDFAGREIIVGASIGIAVADRDLAPEALLRNADVAMYHAKWSGKNRVQMFEDHMSAAAVDRLEIKGDLAHMLDRDELHPYYQPIVQLRGRKVHGFESLARWIHPRRGLVPPDSFIPMTESTGLIVPLGNAILRKSLEQLAIWRSLSTNPLTLSVNMSPRQLLEAGFVHQVEGLLQAFEIDPTWLTMELTESEVLTDSMARRRLTDLGKLGVGIAADDFGSGFASYASLVDLPFTTLKIDRSMLMQIDREPDRTAKQLRSILDMASTMGLKVIAEGVETSAQEDMLLALGCDFAQGYFFGRPAPASSWSINAETKDASF